MKRLAPRLMLVTLLVLACAGMVAQAGSLPHLHKGFESGVYNEEHDLTLLAALAAQALLSDGAPVTGIDTIVGDLPPLSPERPGIRPVLASASRAPPSA